MKGVLGLKYREAITSYFFLYNYVFMIKFTFQSWKLIHSSDYILKPPCPLNSNGRFPSLSWISNSTTGCTERSVFVFEYFVLIVNIVGWSTLWTTQWFLYSNTDGSLGICFSCITMWFWWAWTILSIYNFILRFSILFNILTRENIYQKNSR